MCVHAKSLQLCLTLCDPMNCSLPGSSVHGILQARKLEWVAMPSSNYMYKLNKIQRNKGTFQKPWVSIPERGWSTPYTLHTVTAASMQVTL